MSYRVQLRDVCSCQSAKYRLFSELHLFFTEKISWPRIQERVSETCCKQKVNLKALFFKLLCQFIITRLLLYDYEVSNCQQVNWLTDRVFISVKAVTHEPCRGFIIALKCNGYIRKTMIRRNMKLIINRIIDARLLNHQKFTIV